MPQRLWWKSLNAWSTWALMRPTTRASAAGHEELRLAVAEERVEAPAEEQPALQTQGWHPLRRGRVQAERELDELPQLPSGAGGADVHGHGGAPYMASTSADVFAKARGHERAEQLRARPRGRRAALLPGARGPGAPGRRHGGRRADHARLQQLPRPHGRRARAAGRARRARDLRHRADRLAAAQRHDPPAPGARARDRRVDGRRRRDRLHDRPPGERRHARDDARAGRHGHRRLGRPCVDPRRLPAVEGEAAALPAQPPRQARARARARRGRRRRRRSSSSTACSRWRATWRRCPRSATSSSASARG